MCVIAGGNWNNTSNAGAWAVNLNNVRGNSNNNVGLRSDYVSPQISYENSGTKGYAFLHENAKSEGLAVFSRITLSNIEHQGILI